MEEWSERDWKRVGRAIYVIRQMEKEVERVYATILPRIIREPRKH
jgi:hypothetical protein